MLGWSTPTGLWIVSFCKRARTSCTIGKHCEVSLWFVLDSPDYVGRVFRQLSRISTAALQMRMGCRVCGSY
jgi:hypothetical protein